MCVCERVCVCVLLNMQSILSCITVSLLNVYMLEINRGRERERERERESIHSPQSDICPSVAFVRFLHLLKVEGVRLAGGEFTRRVQLPHKREKVVMISTVVEHLYLTDKLHSDAMVLKLLAFERNTYLYIK